MSKISRKKNESFEAFLRRTKKCWQQSGKNLQVKKIKYFDKTKSKNLQKKSTLHRLNKATKIEYLKKIGRLPEEDRFRR